MSEEIEEENQIDGGQREEKISGDNLSPAEEALPEQTDGGAEDGVSEDNAQVTETDASVKLKKRKLSAWNIVLNTVIAVFAVILIGELIFGIFYSGVYVGGDSMNYTIIGAPTTGISSDGHKELGKGGDYIYVNKFKKPTYSDIVVVWDAAKNENIIKRVVAFGGDTVEFRKGRLYVNSVEIDEEEYVSPDCNKEDVLIRKGFYDIPELTVAENCMYLLGDNRNVSDDSRNSKNGTENGAYDIKLLRGVVPQWSMDMKSGITAVYTFFHFTLFNKG